ncbi:TPA: 50S ribosomal protein L30 [bacterium]|nr:50S ribosomal protein L30 [bacterium]
MDKLKITLKKSRIGRIPKHRKTLDALGLRKMGQSVIRTDNPQIQGMIRQVNYLLEVEEAKE